MDEETNDPGVGTTSDEDSIEIEQLAIRAAVRKRLRGDAPVRRRSRRTHSSRHRMCYSSGNLSSDMAFNPLIYADE